MNKEISKKVATIILITAISLSATLLTYATSYYLGFFETVPTKMLLNVDGTMYWSKDNEEWLHWENDGTYFIVDKREGEGWYTRFTVAGGYEGLVNAAWTLVYEDNTDVGHQVIIYDLNIHSGFLVYASSDNSQALNMDWSQYCGTEQTYKVVLNFWINP